MSIFIRFTFVRNKMCRYGIVLMKLWVETQDPFKCLVNKTVLYSPTNWIGEIGRLQQHVTTLEQQNIIMKSSHPFIFITQAIYYVCHICSVAVESHKPFRLGNGYLLFHFFFRANNKHFYNYIWVLLLWCTHNPLYGTDRPTTTTKKQNISRSTLAFVSKV